MLNLLVLSSFLPLLKKGRNKGRKEGTEEGRNKGRKEQSKEGMCTGRKE
jgi:hypothetical protein